MQGGARQCCRSGLCERNCLRCDDLACEGYGASAVLAVQGFFNDSDPSVLRFLIASRDMVAAQDWPQL